MLLPRLRHRLSRTRPRREELIARHVRDASFVDVGCMWSVHGALAFAAEDAGAASVTGVDVMEPTPEFRAAHERRGSTVRFVRGDLHDEAVVAEVGVHDVVWCSGVIYHAPHPLLTLERLRAMTGRTLILASETLPLRGTRCEFAPPRSSHPGIPTPFDPAMGIANWYWGISPGALRAMVEAVGLRIVEDHRTVYHTTLVAQV